MHRRLTNSRSAQSLAPKLSPALKCPPNVLRQDFFSSRNIRPPARPKLLRLELPCRPATRLKFRSNDFGNNPSRKRKRPTAAPPASRKIRRLNQYQSNVRRSRARPLSRKNIPRPLTKLSRRTKSRRKRESENRRCKTNIDAKRQPHCLKNFCRYDTIPSSKLQIFSRGR